MRILSCNVNGLRSAFNKGFWPWLLRQKADVICLQEIRSREEDLPELLQKQKRFHAFYHPATKPGYSGVAVLSQHRPKNVRTGLDHAELDGEGRYLQLDFANLSVASVYFPSGSSGEPRQQAKYRFLEAFDKRMEKLPKTPVVFCGDFNIAHKQIDIKNWRSNQKNSGFLPEERAWMDRLLEPEKFVDAFRVLNQKADEYTWWSNRGRAYENNVGWRIDYQIVSPTLRNRIQKVQIYRKKKFSDHAPLIVDYDWSLNA
ncbi:MAG: exodeoxyribonuclease III [Bdellovibrionaceae bacterium]|nr:exodeoxyribonuclease III [Pseudobdellovibrionaceae bacterium]